MRVGVCVIRFEVAESASLKDKRQVVRSVKDRARQRFNISIAEVGDLESRTTAELGIACVSNDSRHLDRLLNHVANYIEDEFPLSVLHVEFEIL